MIVDEDFDTDLTSEVPEASPSKDLDLQDDQDLKDQDEEIDLNATDEVLDKEEGKIESFENVVN